MSADPIAEFLTAFGSEITSHVNTEYEDSVAFIGRVLGRRPRATAAAVITVDARGIDVVISDPDGAHVRRLEFPEPVTDPMAITDALLGLVTSAREQSGEPGQTSAEREVAERAGIRTFVTSVVAVEDVHPHLRQLTFGGGDLATFAPAGPDTFLHVLLPPPGRTELTVDQSFTWEANASVPPDEQPVGAYYTLRRWRPDVAELDIQVVLHDDAGPASAWASRAAVGDHVALWGPRSAYHPPPATEALLLVADETGLPAVSVILEQLPADLRATAVVEVGDESEHVTLPADPRIDVTWLHRDGAEPGTTTLLADAVRALPDLPGAVYVWGGGESKAMTAVRRHVRDDRGLPRCQVSLVAYWRRGDDPPLED